MILKELALQFAIKELGKQEQPKGSNWGHPVQDYLAAVSIHFPASWCMAFVYWCFEQAAKEMAVHNPLIRTGGVLNAWNLDAKHRIEKDPVPGDIFIMNHGHGLGHTGLVEFTGTDKDINTVEGNTNDTGSREGYIVLRKERHPGTIIGYLSY